MPLTSLSDAAGLPLVGHSARLTPLYDNDFTSTDTQGRSGGPRGEGPCAQDADSLAPFHYPVVTDTAADGTPAARFPTRRESPGGGQFYSWFQTYVVCRGALVEGDRLYAWTVHLPRAFDLAARCAYHENRHVFALGIENTENHLGLRFANDHTLAWVTGLAEREKVIGLVPLRRPLRPGEALRFTAAVRWSSDAVAISVEAEDGPLAVSIAPQTSLLRASVAVLSSSGNTIGDDVDAALFCRLSRIRVHAVEAGRPAALMDDAPLVPPASR